jgi:rhodanese-related sulfurtransferase
MIMRQIQSQGIPSNAVLIDIRDDLERQVHPIPAGFETLAIALAELEDGNPALPPYPLVVICQTGRQSEYAGALLEALGATQVLILEGGIKHL